MGVNRLSVGEQAFAEKLFDDNYKLLYARAFELLRNVDPSAADDCIGNLFLTLCICCKKVMEHENPQAWLFLTLKYICLKHIRGVGSESKRRASLDEADASAATVSDSLEDSVVNDIVFCQWENENLRERLIAELNPNERKILAMRFKDGLSNKEIAAILGKSEDAVRFTVYYIRKKITDRLYSL